LRINRLVFRTDEHSDIADTIRNIGNSYNDKGDYELAFTNYNKSLNIYRLVFGSSDEHPSIVEILSLIEVVRNKLTSANNLIDI